VTSPINELEKIDQWPLNSFIGTCQMWFTSFDKPAWWFWSTYNIYTFAREELKHKI